MADEEPRKKRRGGLLLLVGALAVGTALFAARARATSIPCTAGEIEIRPDPTCPDGTRPFKCIDGEFVGGDCTPPPECTPGEMRIVTDPICPDPSLMRQECVDGAWVSRECLECEPGISEDRPEDPAVCPSGVRRFECVDGTWVGMECREFLRCIDGTCQQLADPTCISGLRNHICIDGTLVETVCVGAEECSPDGITREVVAPIEICPSGRMQQRCQCGAWINDICL